MHELSVCLALLKQLERIASDRHAGSISSVTVGVGPLAGVEPALLRQAFPLAVAGTVAEHAVLEIESAELRVRCTTCGHESCVAANKLLCAACGDFRTRVVSGDELVLRSVELAGCQPERCAAT